VSEPQGYPLLRVQDLATEFKSGPGRFRAVDEVSFTLGKGRTLGMVGESGCGKSVTALSIMGLVPDPPGKIIGGSIRFEGQELVGLAPERYQALRGNRMGMIFQEPMTSLNPAFTIGDQISEAILRHEQVSPAEAKARTIELLRRVRIPGPEKRFDDYPHKLSGGMRQRAMIAMALSCSPDLLIADEPTTALDVTIQAQILELLAELRGQSGMAIMLITHDLGVVAEMADEVVVMYAGRIVERAPAAALFAEPQHPYTIGLMGSVPRLDIDQERLAAIEGQVPNPAALPAGCRFRARCPFAIARCAEIDPPLGEIAPGHAAACIKAPLESAA
jgi:oligopeptide/dipeptide ABC transporter ATP-binding protein